MRLVIGPLTKKEKVGDIFLRLMGIAKLVKENATLTPIVGLLNVVRVTAVGGKLELALEIQKSL